MYDVYTMKRTIGNLYEQIGCCDKTDRRLTPPLHEISVYPCVDWLM